jgi:hypothetical protein
MFNDKQEVVSVLSGGRCWMDIRLKGAERYKVTSGPITGGGLGPIKVLLCEALEKGKSNDKNVN